MSEQIQIVFMIFTGLIFLSVLIQLIFIAGMSIAMMRLRKKASLFIDELRVHALPILKTSRGMVDEYSPKVRAAVDENLPKIKIAVENLVDATGKVRATTGDATETVRGILEQLRGYAAQTDKTISGTLGRINRAGNSVQQRMAGPLRQMNGLYNAFRAGLNVICSKQPAQPDEPAAQPYQATSQPSATDQASVEPPAAHS